MRNVALWLLVGVVSIPLWGAPKKERVEYIASRMPEVEKVCAKAIRENAKDPESIELEGYSWWAKGKDEVAVIFDGRARNRYGAVIRYKMGCSARCPEGSACFVKFVN